MNRNSAIGVFDSGIGGLTVLNELIHQLPNEDFIFIGDTKNAPYGSKTEEEVQGYIRKIARYLEMIGCKLIVIACNTGTVNSSYLNEDIQTPYIGVIDQTADEAIRRTKTNNVLVLGTLLTIQSGVYQEKLKEKGIHVYAKACPSFVPLIEDNRMNTNESRFAVYEACQEFKHKNIDTLVMGCTHYDLLEEDFRAVFGDIQLISSGKPTAKLVYDYLVRNDCLNDQPQRGNVQLFITGDVEKFRRASGWFNHEHTLSGLNI